MVSKPVAPVNLNTCAMNGRFCILLRILFMPVIDGIQILADQKATKVTAYVCRIGQL